MKCLKKNDSFIGTVILILAFVMIGLLIYDGINVYKTKKDVKEKLDKTVGYIMDGYDYSNDDEITYEYYGTKSKVTIIRNVNLITPGIQLFVKNPYKIEMSEIIYND